MAYFFGSVWVIVRFISAQQCFKDYTCSVMVCEIYSRATVQHPSAMLFSQPHFFLAFLFHLGRELFLKFNRSSEKYRSHFKYVCDSYLAWKTKQKNGSLYCFFLKFVIYVFVVKYVYMSLLQPLFIVWDFALALLGKHKTLYTGTWICTLQANNIHHLPVNTFSAIFVTTYKGFWK